QGETVCEQWREIDSSATHDFHQPSHALFAARAQCRNDSVIADTCRECLVRNLKLARVNTKTGQRSCRPQTAQRILECLLCSKRLDRDVGAAASQTFHRCDHVDISVIECHVCAHAS